MPLSPTAQRKLAELEISVAPAAVVAFLRRLIESGSDFDCYKVNPFRVAEELGVARTDAVRGFLFATRLGILDLNWDVHCPSCRGVPIYHQHLMTVRPKGHCELCAIDWDLDFSEQLEVTFTVNPDVRRIEYPEFSALTFPAHMQWFIDVGSREGRTPVAAGLFQPGTTHELRADLAAGSYIAYVPSHLEHAARIRVGGPPAEGEQAVRVDVAADGSLGVRALELRPGKVVFTVHYGYPKLWGFGVHAETPIKNWLSAAYLTSQQDFRDLFGGEFLSPEASFAVRSTTLMFSDIKGSTEMYEALGDARAYAIVQEHFKLMADIVRRHEGGIIKTIGDAVMAVFPVNVDAVRAACEIQSAFAATGDPLRSVEVKIGLHRGPCIAVTSNRNLDYFGRTVNVAARAQGAALPRQVLLTEAVAEDPAVQALMRERAWAPEPFDVRVKGVAYALRLHSLRPAS